MSARLEDTASPGAGPADAVPALVVADLVVGHGNVAVARMPALTVPKAASVLLVGPSGSGKTTLLLTIAGLARPLSGQALIAGVDPMGLRSKDRDRFRGENVGFVFQEVNLVEGLNALENVLLGAFAVGAKQDRRRAEDLLDRMGLAKQMRQRAETLSRGEAQRVAIARAMLLRPKLILADEPTASLDEGSCETVAGLLAQAMAETGASLVIATHDKRLRDRFPNIIEVGSPA